MRPLRSSPAFRRLWFGTGISAIGSQITTVAIPIQVYHETGSTLLVGLLGIAALIPLLTVSIVAGAVADAVDRRRLLLVSDLALAAVTVGLVLNSTGGDANVPLLFVSEAAATAAYAFQRPARNALTPKLVPDDELLAAIAVEDVVFNLSRVAGPALAGLLIAVLGYAGAYAFDLATFGASLVSIWLLPRLPRIEDAESPSLRVDPRRVPLRAPRAGSARDLPRRLDRDDLRHAERALPGVRRGARRRRRDDRPALCGAVRRCARRVAALGVDDARAATGARRLRRRGGWGIAIAAFGFATAVPLALVMLAVAGAADFVSAVLRSTILLQVTPDSMRGRLSGIELAQVARTPALGNLEAGVVASLVSLRFAIVSGGVLCVAGTAIVAAALPAFRRYEKPA